LGVFVPESERSNGFFGVELPDTGFALDVIGDEPREAVSADETLPEVGKVFAPSRFSDDGLGEGRPGP